MASAGNPRCPHRPCTAIVVLAAVSVLGAPVAMAQDGGAPGSAIKRLMDRLQAARNNPPLRDTRIGTRGVDNSRVIARLIYQLRVALRKRRAFQAQLRRRVRSPAAMQREIAGLQRERIRLRRRRGPYEARRRAYNREVAAGERARHHFNRTCTGSMSRARWNHCQNRRNRLLAWKARLSRQYQRLQAELNYVNRRFRYIASRVAYLHRAIGAARNRGPRLRAQIAALNRQIAGLNSQLRGECGRIITCVAKRYCQRAPWQGAAPALRQIRARRC